MPPPSPLPAPVRSQPKPGPDYGYAAALRYPHPPPPSCVVLGQVTSLSEPRLRLVERLTLETPEAGISCGGRWAGGRGPGCHLSEQLPNWRTRAYWEHQPSLGAGQWFWRTESEAGGLVTRRGGPERWLGSRRVLRVDEQPPLAGVSGASAWVCRVQWSRQWLGSGRGDRPFLPVFTHTLPPCTLLCLHPHRPHLESLQGVLFSLGE